MGTARNLRSTLTSFTEFLHGRDIAFSLLDEVVIGEYADWLAKRGITSNSSSFYMRNLRSVYNRAVREEGIKQTFPFRYVYTGIDKTAKRSVDEEIIIRLKELELKDMPTLQFTRDLFLLATVPVVCPLWILHIFVAKTSVTAIFVIHVRRQAILCLYVLNAKYKNYQPLLECYGRNPFPFPDFTYRR